MRILFLGNNWLGWQVLHWLKEEGESIVGLVVHPLHKRKYGEELLRTAALTPDTIFDGSCLKQTETLHAIRDLRADIALSVLFGYILVEEYTAMFPAGAINLHPAFLPYNRGAHPNIWSIVEDTPAGATLHCMDESVDTGDIIAQRQGEIEPTDTGQSLYSKLECCSLDLFKDTWPLIRSGDAARSAQHKGIGTYHRSSDVRRIDHIDLDRLYSARELIDILRARSFPPYPGAYFVHKDRRVYLRLELLWEDQLDQ